MVLDSLEQSSYEQQIRAFLVESLKTISKVRDAKH